MRRGKVQWRETADAENNGDKRKAEDKNRERHMTYASNRHSELGVHSKYFFI